MGKKLAIWREVVTLSQMGEPKMTQSEENIKKLIDIIVYILDNYDLVPKKLKKMIEI